MVRIHARQVVPDEVLTRYVIFWILAWLDILGHFFQRLASSRGTKNSTDYRVVVTTGSHGSSSDVEAHRLKGRLSIFLTGLKTVTCNNNIYLLLLCCSGQSGKGSGS
jgi:hypothetical protein